MSNYTILNFDLSAAQTVTPWKRNLDSTSGTTRAITGTLTSGDTIIVQMTNEVLNSEKQFMETEVSTSNYAASPSQTATVFDLGYDGNFRWIRVVKTGSNGVARVTVEC